MSNDGLVLYRIEYRDWIENYYLEMWTINVAINQL